MKKYIALIMLIGLASHMAHADEAECFDYWNPKIQKEEANSRSHQHNTKARDYHKCLANLMRESHQLCTRSDVSMSVRHYVNLQDARCKHHLDSGSKKKNN